MYSVSSNTLVFPHLAGVVRPRRSVPLVRRKITLLGFASGVVAGLAGCVTQAPVERAPVAATAPVARTSLTDAAVAALQAAEQSVTDARAKRALWTSAQERLTQARLAARIFDSAATIAHAEEVVKLCALSIQQLQSPPVKW